VPRPEIIAARTPVTRSALAADLRRLGLRPGATVMLHTALSALGWVVGGSQTVVEALLDCVGDTGTLCAQASWEDVPFGLADWPARWRAAYEAELPAFDPALAAAAPYVGRLPERLRTWPGARRSASPATGIVALGAGAAALTADHRLDDSFGAGTPYARILDAGGVVLALGAPLHAITLLHHAEAMARARKRWTTYRLPVLRDGVRQWSQIREIDVWRGVYPYERVVACGERPLATIAGAALAAGAGRSARVAGAEAYLFDGRALVAFAVRWLEARFAPAGARTRRPAGT
jgi:aminoglycoside 3-N-acetyltransferase